MYRRILIVVSDRPEAKAALVEGLGLAKVHGACVLLLHVLPNFDAAVVGSEMGGAAMPPDDITERGLRQHAEGLLTDASVQADRMGIRAEAMIRTDDAVSSITGAAIDRACDLTVVGTEQRNAVMRLLTGSAIPGLITQAPVPVLVCHERPLPAQ